MLNIGKRDSHTQSRRMISKDERVKMDEVPLFDFDDLVTATNNFHSSNKLGQGGFGSVYKVFLS